MFFSQDMRDLLSLFDENEVQYLLVGGFAVNFYGYTRATQDIDLLVYPSVKNAGRVMESLEGFGFGGAGIPRSLFENTGGVIHLGVEPNRIDLLTHVVGVSNDRIFQNAQRVDFEGILVNVIAFQDLVESKRRSKRPRDLADAEELQKLRSPKSR